MGHEPSTLMRSRGCPVASSFANDLRVVRTHEERSFHARILLVVPKILLIDNYDSFTYNLVQAFLVLGAVVEVHRNDAITTDEAAPMPA